MKKGGGSNKGSSFEREACKEFSRWVSEGSRDDVFWRTAGSGARATNRAKKGSTTHNSEGDMCCLDPEYEWFLNRFMVEMKCGYPQWNVGELFAGKVLKDGLWSVWNRLEVDSKAVGKLPLLVLKQDRRPILFFTTIRFSLHFMSITSDLFESDMVFIGPDLWTTHISYLKRVLRV